MNDRSGKERFAMVKKHHLKTLENAISDKLIDEQMVAVCRTIGKTKNYFTSSSCAGRIMLLDVCKEGDKRESDFHRKWHREVNFDEVLDGVKAQTKGILWLRAEPFIIHIICSSLDYARELLRVKDKAGVRRGGISVAKEGKFLVELTGTQYLSVPVKDNGEIIVTEEYLSKLVEYANKKMRLNYERLEKFHDTCKKALD